MIDILLPRPTSAPPVAEDVLIGLPRCPIGVAPLSEQVRRGDRVVISACDHTRPQPRVPMLRALLDQLQAVRDARHHRPPRDGNPSGEHAG